MLFQAYAAGCDIVILASDFQRVQIIPGAIHGNIQVTCIDCCADSGKVRIFIILRYFMQLNLSAQPPTENWQKPSIVGQEDLTGI